MFCPPQYIVFQTFVAKMVPKISQFKQDFVKIIKLLRLDYFHLYNHIKLPAPMFCFCFFRKRSHFLELMMITVTAQIIQMNQEHQRVPAQSEFLTKYIWGAPRENVPNVLSCCHTKRLPVHPSSGMTPTFQKKKI